ncbi:hypothetical protein [Undibacterium pigrum]|uniref:Uncharacterized protein n=1 Tax=Undibacterium pigrum TaxID=401470 RepID=A0A318JI08_9BURK|nr:hypothetical protein [Undibacterium pigrum]PXX47039.1 hypothetical protein DFR42_101615 [Undibacterium pigrum]
MSAQHHVVELTKANLVAAQTITTNLTPNSNSVAIASGDINNQTGVAFQFQGRVTYWNPSVSTSATTATLANDIGNGVVTYKKGLTVTYQPLQTAFYNVLLDGQVVDSGTLYNFTGAVLGTFARKDT